MPRCRQMNTNKIKEMTMFDNIDNMARIEREIGKRMDADYE